MTSQKNDPVIIQGNIVNMFGPIDSNKTIVDKFGYEWRQITYLGWKREIDNFFWPADPTNMNNCFNKLPPTVAEVINDRLTMTEN